MIRIAPAAPIRNSILITIENEDWVRGGGRMDRKWEREGVFMITYTYAQHTTIIEHLF
jgi:hypothetical protein